jgi:hypothetical protein
LERADFLDLNGKRLFRDTRATSIRGEFFIFWAAGRQVSKRWLLATQIQRALDAAPAKKGVAARPAEPMAVRSTADRPMRR